MKKLISTAVLLLIFSVSAAYSTTVYHYPLESAPGELITILVISEHPLEDYGALLKNNSGELIKYFKGFTYYDPVLENLGCMVIPASFDFNLKPGEYIITLTGKENNLAGEHTFTIELKKREFRSISITLNSELSDLRTQVTDRRTAETRLLIQQLAEFNSENIYLDEEILKPLIDPYITTSRFGDRRNFIYTCGNNASSYHYGIDLAVETGTPVYAAASGRVVFSDERVITGNSVIIEHLPGFYSIYYHLDELFAKKDEIIKIGAVIGTVGSTGLSTGPHLHWELRNQSVPVDPLTMLGISVIDKDTIIGIINDNFQHSRRGGD